MSLGTCILIVVLSATLLLESSHAETPSSAAYFQKSGTVLSARIAELTQVPKFGDLWPSTWAADDNLYLAWGDGTGLGPHIPVIRGSDPSKPYIPIAICTDDALIYKLILDEFRRTFAHEKSDPSEPCLLTQAGLFRLEGPVGAFRGCGRECTMSIHIPTGIPQFEEGVDPYTRRTDKASSLLYCDGTLYWAGHEPSGIPRQGYIAYSTDSGRSWSEVPGTPWTEKSSFRVLMFINMGRNYDLNKDGYVYGLGIGEELGQPPRPQSVYLTRVPKDKIKEYGKYTYFAGVDGSRSPRWSGDQADAEPVAGLQAVATGAAMYHPGIKRFLFLVLTDFGSGTAVALYEGIHPWGPWSLVQVFEGHRFIPGIIAKDTGPASFYFTAAGGSATYQLNIGRIEMQVTADGSSNR